ncbi:MAG: sensor histidine kinase, partial [Acidimicrobiales bacterium]
AEVVLTGDLPALPAGHVEAVAGAVGEALTNAAKHGGATRVVVYAEVDGDGLFCSVKDNGAGCDVAALRPGVGVERSIRGRIEELGGRVELAGAAGSGMEVRMWLGLGGG